MKLRYQPDPYIETIFTRMLGNYPEGTFYQLFDITIPHTTITPTKFKIILNESDIGYKFRLSSDQSPNTLIFNADKVETIVGIFLDAGKQTLTLDKLSNNDTVLISTILPVKIADYGTLTYAIALTIARQWADTYDYYIRVSSKIHLIIFESSLSDQLRLLLPVDINLRLIALKNLVKVKNISSSSEESIVLFSSCFCDMNPVKLTRHINDSNIDHKRLLETEMEISTLEINMWFDSVTVGRRAVLARFAHNFPERYRALEGLDSELILHKNENYL